MGEYADREAKLSKFSGGGVDDNRKLSLPERIEFNANGYITLHYNYEENNGGNTEIKRKRLSLRYSYEGSGLKALFGIAKGKVEAVDDSEVSQSDAAKSSISLDHAQMSNVINKINSYHYSKDSGAENSKESRYSLFRNKRIDFLKAIAREMGTNIGDNVLGHVLADKIANAYEQSNIKHGLFKYLRGDMSKADAEMRHPYFKYLNRKVSEAERPKMQNNRFAALQKLENSEQHVSDKLKTDNFGAGQEVITRDYVRKNLGKAKYIKISSDVKTIDKEAFKGCKSLEIVDFSGCSALENIKFEAFKDGKSLKIVDLSGCSTLKDLYVTFYDCESLKSVDFSGCSSLKEIGYRAFGDCISLASVDLSSCSALKEICKDAFKGCSGLKIILSKLNLALIGGLEKFKKDVLADNDDIQIEIVNHILPDSDGYYEINLPDGQDYVKDKDVLPFKILNKDKIRISDSAAYVDEGAFKFYSQLIEVIGDNITELADGAFYFCENLRIVKFPNLKQCPSSAFIDCNNLDLDKSVLPQNLKLEIKAAQELRKIELEKGKNTATTYLNDLLGISDREAIKNKVIEGDKKNENYLKNNNYDEVDFVSGSFKKYIKDNFAIDGLDIKYEEIKGIIKNFVKLDPGTHKGATGMRNGYFAPGIHKPQDYIDNIPKAQAVVNRFTNKKELVLNRGVGNYDTVDYMVLGGQKAGTFRNDPNALVGKIIADDSFTSTSFDKSNSEGYMRWGNNTGEGVMFKLIVPPGRNMAPITDYESEIVANRKQKYVVVDVGKYEKPSIRQVIAVALPSDETGIERHKKGENGEKLFSKQTSNELYADPDFAKLQEEYEINLGKYAYSHPLARQGVQTALNKIANKLKNESLAAYNNDLYELFKDKFLVDKPELSGAVGRNLSRDDLFALLEVDVPNDVQNKMAENSLERGNLREKMMAFEVAVGNGQKGKKSFLSESRFGDIIPYIGRVARGKNEQNKQLAFLRHRDYQDRMGLPRSQREREYQENYYNALTPNDRSKSPITYGEMLYKPDTGRNILYNNFMGKRLVAGSSGHAMRFLQSCQGLGMSRKELINFRLALIGCLIPERNHSLYEILQGAMEAGLVGGEILNTAESMDKFVAPLAEKELREKVCKYTLKGYEKYIGLFPIEALAEKKAE